MSPCKSRSRENITAAAIVPFIEGQPTENKKLRFAKEKLRIFWCGVFCPLTGMVLYDYQIKGFFKEFSPPYGDDTSERHKLMQRVLFSPPYGDGTEIVVTANYREWFSPPYGDGTTIVGLDCEPEMFSPPYGDGTDRNEKRF